MSCEVGPYAFNFGLPSLYNGPTPSKSSVAIRATFIVLGIIGIIVGSIYIHQLSLGCPLLSTGILLTLVGSVVKNVTKRHIRQKPVRQPPVVEDFVRAPCTPPAILFKIPRAVWWDCILPTMDYQDQIQLSQTDKAFKELLNKYWEKQCEKNWPLKATQKPNECSWKDYYGELSGETLILAAKLDKLTRTNVFKASKWVLGHKSGIFQMEIQGNKIISESSKAIKIWDLDTGNLLRTLEIDEGRRTDGGMYVTNDKIFAMYRYWPCIRMWDLQTGEFKDIPFSSQDFGMQNGLEKVEGNTLIFCHLTTRDMTVYSLNEEGFLNLDRPVKLCGHTAFVKYIKIIDNLIISSSHDKILKMWDRTTGTCLHTHQFGTEDFARCGWEYSEEKIWYASKNKLMVYDPEVQKKSVVQEHTDTIRMLKIAGHTVISASTDQITVFDKNTWREQQLQGPQISTYYENVQIVGNLLVAASMFEVSMWNLGTGELLQQLRTDEPLTFKQLHVEGNKIAVLRLENWGTKKSASNYSRSKINEIGYPHKKQWKSKND